MTATVICPHCGRNDVNLQTGFCNSCGGALDLPPQSTEIVRRAPASETPPTASEGDEHSQSQRREEAASRGDWETWEKTVFEAHEDGFRIVTLIGFSESGKTFFANRLRQQFTLAPKWTVWRGQEEKIPKTIRSIECTEFVRHGWRKRQYLLADVDGEAYRASVEDFTLSGSGGPVERRYALLVGLASAYVLMIPSHIDLYSQTLVERFNTIVGYILAMQQRLRETADVRAAVAQPLTANDARKALRESIRCAAPVQVLFAQADLFADVGKHDTDPQSFAMLNANSLYRTIDKHFATYRFDFVSAFDGYKENKEAKVDYRLPAYGTKAAFNWIDRVTAPPLLIKPLYRVSTRAAQAMRWLLDPSYRRVRAKARR